MNKPYNFGTGVLTYIRDFFDFLRLKIKERYFLINSRFYQD